MTMSKTGYRRTSVVALDRTPLFLSRPLSTLSAAFISREDLNFMFGLRKGTDCMARFIELNSANMRFLDIYVKQVYEPERKGIIIYTGRYAGAIPIKSPKTSLYTVDLKVRGSYSPNLEDDELYSILTETGAELLPEFDEKLHLKSDGVKPPIYMECEHFIRLYDRALEANWTKFTNETRVESQPRGITNWSLYAAESYNPEQLLKFENHVNAQTIDHYEWRQINYVLDKALRILNSSATFNKAKMRNRQIINKLRNRPEAASVIWTSHIPEHAVDSPIIKDLKKVGNMILADNSDIRCAWRLDIAKLYEIYVQYLVKTAAPEWHCVLNPHFPIYGQKASWGLRYLEPDIILSLNDRQIVIDAKYKSNMLGRNDVDAPNLKESFRQDLHQVLAYSAFEPSEEKQVMLIYPYSNNTEEDNDAPVRIMRQIISSPLSNRKIYLSLLGVPFRGQNIKEVILALRQFIRAEDIS